MLWLRVNMNKSKNKIKSATSKYLLDKNKKGLKYTSTLKYKRL